MAISRAEGDYTRRFIMRRLGYVRNWVSLRIRVVSRNKIALCDLRVFYS